jgi:Gas vesicle synthesis protein GvpO
MAERTRSEKRQRRSEAREKRRSLAAKPFEELDEAAGAEEREGPSRSPLRQAATTAVLGAVVAGAAGAAKALADRSGEEPAAEQDSDENESEGRPEGSAAEEDGEQPESREPDEQQADGDDEQPQADGDDEQPQAAADAGDPESEDQGADGEEQPQAQMQSRQGDEATEDEPQEPEDEPQQPDDSANGSGGTPKGASSDDVKEIVEEAKRELQELLGTEPEKVSGFHRSNGRWTVTLEVVSVRRVPDTTDVLSSYEVAFDDDRNLVSLSETRRYRRSQVEEG